MTVPIELYPYVAGNIMLILSVLIFGQWMGRHKGSLINHHVAVAFSAMTFALLTVFFAYSSIGGIDAGATTAFVYPLATLFSGIAFVAMYAYFRSFK